MTKTINQEMAVVEIETLAEELRNVIGRFVRTVRLQSATPTDAQGETLAFLERLGPVSIAALADHRGVKHQSMRLVIAKLEQAGLIVLRPDPQDRRCHLVVMTGAGLAATDVARRARALWIAEALTTTLSSHELKTLKDAVPLLGRIADLKPSALVRIVPD